ncbi:MAG: malto-oligosyltrehalose trehalohydrolase [Nitrospirota bacterium]
MKRKHEMRFGARVLPGGGAEFRLWAPAAEKVELCLQHGLERKFFEMDDLGGGWRGIRNLDARHGMLYWYRINGETLVPDPASRFQPEGALGSSQVIDPEEFEWTDGQWQGRPWEESIFYELHVGAATKRGTFDSLKERLDYIADLGATAIQLMPVNSFPGRRNWGYDGVLPFAPKDTYGRPEDLKSLVCEAHTRGLMVFLDVVYNHFGPLGNYLGLYAPQFFTRRHVTPWGDAINFDGDESETVREFFITNALYWLVEYNFDGLRLDAADWLIDNTRPDFTTEMASVIRRRLGYKKHLVMENDDNPVEYLRRDESGRPKAYNAMWDEDLHHCLHVLTTGETGGYYQDYRQRPVYFLARSLTEGYAYQGEWSDYRKKNRGSPTEGLHSTSFIVFIQNHDQVGNRPMGDRIHKIAKPKAVRAMTEIFLLSPAPPLIFMGQEYASESPFPFFSDLSPELAPAVYEGRLRHFSEKLMFNERYNLDEMPDPFDEKTFRMAKLDYERLPEPGPAFWHKLYKDLIEIRRKEIVPRLKGVKVDGAGFEMQGDSAFKAWWTLNDGNILTLAANLGDDASDCPELPDYPPLYKTDNSLIPGVGAQFHCARGRDESHPCKESRAGGLKHAHRLSPWTVIWFIGASSRFQ